MVVRWWWWCGGGGGGAREVVPGWYRWWCGAGAARPCLPATSVRPSPAEWGTESELSELESPYVLINSDSMS